MLVLTRKENESIVIDGKITVTLLEIGGGRIRLGIEAPQDIPVVRSELLEPAARSVMIEPFVLPNTAETLALAH
jgi:carbon storage regulator